MARKAPASLPDLPPIILQPKQRQLLELCRATGQDVPTTLMFGGARGGAKSGGIRRIALALLWEHENTTAYIIQRTSKDLYDGHISKLSLEFPQLAPYWSAQHNEYKLPGGRRLAFRFADTEKDVIQLSRGPEPTWEFVDQAEQFSEGELRALKMGIRNPGVEAGLCKQVLAFNPGGIGTAYLRRIGHTRDFHDNERREDYVFLKAVGWDNYEWFRPLGITPREFCDMPDEERFQIFIRRTAYGQVLWALPESQRLGQLYGSFDQFEGQYYAEVWEESRLVLPPDIVARIIQPWWRRWLATDWGFSHYACVTWWAAGLLSPEQVRDYFGVEMRAALRIIIVYRELVCNDVPEPDLARVVLSMTPQAERREIREHWIGHDAFAKRGSANTIAEQLDPIYQAGGLPRVARADIDRVGGWRLLYNAWANARRMRKAVGVHVDPAEEPPCLFVSAACPEVQKAVPLLMCSRKNPQDVEKFAGAVEDDVADCIRYGLKSYLSAVDQPPLSVTAAETYAAYEDPTARAMAMLRLSAKNDSELYIRRRPRA